MVTLEHTLNHRMELIILIDSEDIKMKFKCPCCGNYTLNEQPPGTYEICVICNWEDDEVQYNDPTYAGGANELCLNDARKLYQIKMGVEQKK